MSDMDFVNDPSAAGTNAPAVLAGKRILVVGCPGSGKSVFSERLRKITGLPLVHLDNIWWRADRTHISRDEFDRALDSLLSRREWIIDGDYSRTYETRIRACDTIIFLDFDPEECLSGLRERLGKRRPDLPWIETEPDPELAELVRAYPGEKRPILCGLIGKYGDKQTLVFPTRAQAEAWLSRLERDPGPEPFAGQSPGAPGGPLSRKDLSADVGRQETACAPAVIETDRLRLRKAADRDLEKIWNNVWRDERLAGQMLWAPTATLAEARQRMERTKAYQAETPAFFVCLRETDEPIGFAGVRESAPGEYEETGICLAADYQRRGLGKELLQALVELVFERLGGRRFVYGCFRENLASAALCRSCGFVYSHSRPIRREYDGYETQCDYYERRREPVGGRLSQ